MPRVMAHMFVCMCLEFPVQNCLRISMLFITRVKMSLILESLYNKLFRWD